MCLALCGAECPRACECKWKNGKEAVLCVNGNLSTIPDELDAGTQVLDFTGNAVTEIVRDAFSDAGLTNLQKIYLAKCRIKTLHRFAFRKLTNLVELDLSFNQLTAVPSHIFESISELREVKLSGNPIQRVSNDAFKKVPQLVRLELSECRIGTLEQRAFFGLEKSLEWLRLDQNQMVAVRAATLMMLKNLHGLDLHGNPWNCSCVLRPMREWMLTDKIPYSVPPVCSSPPRVAGKSWDKLDLDDFACVPEIVARVLVTKGVEGSNVTMSCKIDGIPEPRVKWLWKNKVITNLTGSVFSRKTYVVQELGDTEKASNLTIMSAEVQDAGVYICAAENKAGKVEANITLAMSRKAPEPPLTGRVVIAGIIVAALFIIALSLIVICACTIRRKNNLRTVRRRRREDSYEKIEMNHKGLGMNGGNPPGVSVSAASLQHHEIRKHGDYRGVSCVADPADTLSGFKKYSPKDQWDGRSPDGANSSEAGHNADTESCAASRNLVSDSETSDPETLKSAAAASFSR
jgi:netrin-G1 ligand